MNGLRADLSVILEVSAAISPDSSNPEVLLCLPSTLILEAARQVAGAPLKLGGQTCHASEIGAYTGDVSALMLRDAGASYVIAGHSERRTGHGESDEIVAAQAVAVVRAGLTPIICVGETHDERTSGATLEVISQQLAGSLAGLSEEASLVLAYEPLWAIGTGKVAEIAQIAEVHGFIRSVMAARFGPAGHSIRILYGGSLGPANARDILGVPDVDGGLVGGASLKAADFLSIYATASALTV